MSCFAKVAKLLVRVRPVVPRVDRLVSRAAVLVEHAFELREKDVVVADGLPESVGIADAQYSNGARGLCF